MTIHSSADGHASAGLADGHASAGFSDGHASAGFGIKPSGDGAARCGARDIGAGCGAGCAVAGDPSGRRIVLVHANSSEARAWTRLLRAVPAGQEWVSVARPDPGPTTAAALRPLLTLRRARKPLLVGCGTGVSVALRAALDFPDLVGGLLLVDPTGGEAARPSVLRRIAARLMPPAVRSTAEELQSMGPLLASIRVPVTLVQGKDEPPGLLGTPFLEQALSGCRNLTVVTVPGVHVQPAKHEPAVRTALAALVAAVERGGA